MFGGTQGNPYAAAAEVETGALGEKRRDRSAMKDKTVQDRQCSIIKVINMFNVTNGPQSKRKSKDKALIKCRWNKALGGVGGFLCPFGFFV